MDIQTLLTLKEKALKKEPYPNPNFPPSEYYRFFELLVEELQPKLSIELGVNGGGGSLHLAKGYKNGVVVGVDKGNEYPDNIRYIQENYPNFAFWVGDSIIDSPIIAFDYGLPDIIFFDTVHEIPHVTKELNAWKMLLGDKPCLLCFDDLWRAEMLGFWETIPQPKVRMDELHPGSTEGGFGVWLYNH